MCPKNDDNSLGAAPGEADRKNFHGNIFMNDDRNIRLDISDGNCEDAEEFWQNTSALFTADCLYVIIKTPKSTF